MIDRISLNNSYKIPPMGIGPGSVMRSHSISFFGRTKIGVLLNKICNRFLFKYKAKKYVRSIVHALNSGYRLIDYSAAYGSENLVGKAIRKSGINRNEIFVTTRITNRQQREKQVRLSFFISLKNLGLEYIDLYMFHWPVTDYYENTWLEMIKLYNEGYIKTLGVANCHKSHLEKLLKISDIVPAINQIEVHPLFTQKTLISFCKSKGIIVEAYTAIARFDDRLVRLPKLKNIANKYNKTVVQIIIRWHIQNGVIPIIRSSNFKRQIENISVFDFELTEDEILVVDSFNINSRLRYDPDNCDFSIL